MGVGSGAYNFFLLLHILSAIAGFGAVMLNAVYGLEAKKRPGPAGLAVAEANHRASMVGEIFIYLVPVWGLVLVWASDGAISLGDNWVWTSIVLYVAALGVSHGMLLPTTRRMRGLMGELVAMGPPPAGAAVPGPPPQVAELEALGKRVGMLGGMLNLAVVAVLVLMIWKPGA